MKKETVELAAVLALTAAVVASGIWIVYIEHRSRQLFIAAEEQSRELDRLEIEWGRLQIEQSTWATPSRIEALARQRLQLTVPSGEALAVVVQPVKP
jgi:cell division protein FtsL